MLRILCAAIAAAFLCVSCSNEAEPSPEAAALEQLRAGGFVLVLRHANSPSGQEDAQGRTEGCQLADGRGLDAEGLKQAEAVAGFIAAERIPVTAVYTSDLCRSWDTATIGFGAATPHPAQKTTDADLIAAFKKEVEAELAETSGGNIALVSHSNVAPLYGAEALATEEELPSGVVYMVDPSDWGTRTRIDLREGYNSQSVTVE